MSQPTFMHVIRAAALMESRALRCYWRAGDGSVPPYAPVDYWDDWLRSKHNNATTKRKTA